MQTQAINCEPSDEVLMQQYVKGDAKAFRLLFKRYHPILLRLLRRRGANGVEVNDYVQQTFLQLYRARDDYRRGKRLRPYLITIALNVHRADLRRQGRHPEETLWGSEQTETMDDHEITDPIEHEQEVTRVRLALSQLPANQRKVIEMHWFEELSFYEIAELIGMSLSAVKVRASRGYGRLRKALRENETS